MLYSPTLICNNPTTTTTEPGAGDGSLDPKLVEVLDIFQELDDKIPKDLRDFDPDSDLAPEDLGIVTDLRERDIMINPMLFQTSSSRFDRALRNKKVRSRQTL